MCCRRSSGASPRKTRILTPLVARPPSVAPPPTPPPLASAMPPSLWLCSLHLSFCSVTALYLGAVPSHSRIEDLLSYESTAPPHLPLPRCRAGVSGKHAPVSILERRVGGMCSGRSLSHPPLLVRPLALWSFALCLAVVGVPLRSPYELAHVGPSVSCEWVYGGAR